MFHSTRCLSVRCINLTHGSRTYGDEEDEDRPMFILMRAAGHKRVRNTMQYKTHYARKEQRINCSMAFMPNAEQNTMTSLKAPNFRSLFFVSSAINKPSKVKHCA